MKVFTPIHRLAAIAIVLATASPALLRGQEIFGANRIECPAGSDTLVTMPFYRMPVYKGDLASFTVIDDTVRIVPAVPDALAGLDLVEKPHYLQFRADASLPGVRVEVTSADADSISVAAGDFDLTGLQVGDRLEVIPHWTLATLFPARSQTALHPSPSLLPGDRKSMLLFADITSQGIDLAPDRAYFLTERGGWFRVGNGFPPGDDTIVPPGASFVIRHPEGVEPTVFLAKSRVFDGADHILIRTRTDGPQDNHLGLVRPVPVRLADLDLGEDVFVDSASDNPADRRDEIVTFDNTEALQNKTPSAIYFRVAGQWRLEDGDSALPADEAEILPSTAIVLRKYQTATGETLVWTNLPRY